MRKGFTLIPLIMICYFTIGCEKPAEEPAQLSTPDNRTVVKELMKAQPVLEIAATEQKTEEEKAKQAEAEELTLARANPFLTKEEEEAFKETQGRIIIEDMNLSAIMYSPPNSKVIINGTILKEGDAIGPKKILEIQPKMVILKDEITKREYILKTKGVQVK